MKKIVTLLIALAFVGTSQQVSAVSTFSVDFSTAQQYTITGTKTTGKNLKVFLNHELVADFVEAQGSTYSLIKPTEVGLYAVNSTTGKYRPLFPVKKIKNYRDKNVTLKTFKPSASMKGGYNTIVAITKLDDGAGKTKQVQSAVYTLGATNPDTSNPGTPNPNTPGEQNITLSVTAPSNNAEVIIKEDTTIRWNTNIPAKEKATISLTNAAGTRTVVKTNVKNNGVFEWKKAGIIRGNTLPAGAYVLKVEFPGRTAVGTTNILLKSPTTGNPSTPANKVVTITAPNSNAELTLGEEQSIRWTTNVDVKEKATISLTNTAEVKTVIKENAKNEGEFVWNKVGHIRGMVLLPGTYTLRVEFPELNAAAATTVILKSAPLIDPRQPMVDLKAPEAGSTFKVGESIEFKWDTKNIPANTPGFIQFIGGTTTYNITNFTNNGKHTVRIDGQSVPLGTYTVKLIFGQASDSITGIILKAADTTTTPTNPPTSTDEYRCYIHSTAGSGRARWLEVECDSKAFNITPINQRMQIKKRNND